MVHRQSWMVLGFALAAALAAAGCGNGSGSGEGARAAAPTATPESTPLATPTTGAGASVNFLVVVNRDVTAGTDDALAPSPEREGAEADNASFDRALSFADWSVAGVAGQQGLTGSDGRFQISGLAPGRYTLELTKTLDGNLAALSVPFVVGDDGHSDVVAEMSWGLVRASSSYLENGIPVREVHAPNGTVLATRDDRVSMLGETGQPFIDPDGDGTFERERCVDHLWLCPDLTGCGDDRVCSCTASCPFCEDCGPGVCVPPGIVSPYRCNDDGGCALPGDRCVCASSCPDCDDCALSVCVPTCEPVEIIAVEIVGGPSQLALGQRGSMRAVAQLSDGTRMDVTYLVDWESSDPAVASVDSWGTVSALAIGTTSVTAAIGTLASEAWQLEVVERPALRAIHVQNVSCFYPLGRPQVDGETPPVLEPPATDMLLPPPPCRQVVQVGGTIQFQALGEFENGHYEDITDEVQWQLVPPEVGDVVGGLFTARQAGVAKLTASLGAVTSGSTEVRVVTEPTVVALSIYAENWGFPVFLGLPVDAAGAPLPCFDCGYAITVLRGDTLQFRATAQYDTGAWEDVTERVTWQSSDTAVAQIDASGLMTAVEGGETLIDAALDEVVSNPVDVQVVNDATLQRIYIYQEGTDRVLAKGDQAFFHATGSYDVGFERDVTTEATWRSSDVTVGGFDAPGVFTGRGAGTVEVWAELDGKKSERRPLEVFETSELSYCDPEHVNRGAWSDDFNRVVLESNCAEYEHPDVAALRYTVTEARPHGGIFDPCLDLYVYQGNRRIRTLREEGCGDPFLAMGAPERDQEVLKYQLRAFWDLKDDTGAPVPPGVYTVFGRFYLYYDPVVSIQIAVVGQDGKVPCTENPCGNGCGYVHACGDSDSPLVCPDVCVSLCECPPGWGITPEGGCERCAQECCAPGAACLPGQPPCEIECCPPDVQCRTGIPPCERRCCPLGATCTDDIPPCELECCPPNARCTPDIHPCEPECCPPGASCGPWIPPCEPPKDCCPEGEACEPGLPPCGPECCPANQQCTPDVPPCQPACCLPGDACPSGLPPCEQCCPIGALCILPWPPCEEPCCAPNESCAPGIPPCPPLADLVPSGVRPGPCSLADCVPRPLVEVCVANQGEQAAEAFSVLAGEGQFLRFAGVAPGDEECAQAPYANSITVAVDVEGEVLESREDNNRQTFTPPTPVPTACDFIPPDCTPEPTPSATPTPTPWSEGVCYRGVTDCAGSGFSTSRERCCEISRLDASILAVSWCPNNQSDPTIGACRACVDPCSDPRTPSRTPSPKATPTPVECGDGIVSAGEQCDDGNRTSGDGCAEDCTLEDGVIFGLGEGSKAAVQTESFGISLPLTGQLVITTTEPTASGDPSLDGTVPLVVQAAGVQFDPVPVPGLLCAYVQGVESPEFGPRIAGTGVIGCADAGLEEVDYLFSIDHDAAEEDPNCSAGIVEDGSLAHPHLGACNGEPNVRFTGGGPRGSMVLDLNTAIRLIYDGGLCDANRTDPATGQDGLSSNSDDPFEVATTRLLLTTGAASAEVLNAGGVSGARIGPGSLCGGSPCNAAVTGRPLDCDALVLDPGSELSGVVLAGAVAALDVELVGDVVVTTELVARAVPVTSLVSIGNAMGAPGSTVEVSVTLDTNGQEIAATQNDIVFDPAVVDLPGLSSCRINPLISDLVEGCEDDPASGPCKTLLLAIDDCPWATGCPSGSEGKRRLRTGVISLQNTTSIPDGVVLYSCAFEIASDAAGVVQLENANVGASDPNGEALPVVGVSGHILVLPDGVREG